MFTEARLLIKLAFPVFIAQLAITSMSFVDAAMAGHFSRIDLAAIAIGGSFWLPAFLFTQAILFAVTPIVAQAHGSQNHADASHALKQGLWLGLLAGICVAIILYHLLPVLGMMGVDANIEVIARNYLLWLCLALPIVGIYQAMRSFIEGNGRTKPVMVINFIGFLAHIPLNYICIYGKLGMPVMGGAGCGLSMVLALLIMATGLALYILTSDLRLIVGASNTVRPQWLYQRNLFRLGFPIGCSMLAEVSVFSIIALLVAPLGAEVVAGHQVALNLSSQTFMLPFSLSMALTIRVGYLLGKEDLLAAKHTAHTGLCLALLSASCTASFMVFGSGFITGIYTSDKEVQVIAASLLFFSAVFQFPDALQVSSIGILRGFKITRLPMFYTIFAYWVIALPIGYALGLTDLLGEALGARGLWMGLVLGLSIAAFLLLITVFYVLKHPQKYLSRFDV
jgi:multidrug resistance protein, MATE family